MLPRSVFCGLLVALGSFCRPVSPFCQVNSKHPASATDTTRLFGFRAKTRQNIANLRDKLRKPASNTLRTLSELDDSSSQQHAPEGADRYVKPAVDVSKNDVDQNGTNIIAQELPQEEVPPFEVSLPSKSAPFVQLPPLDAKSLPQSKAEEEFREKIAHFERYSQRDIAQLRSTRLRIVMEGMAASPLEPAVYRAFEILYQDLPPLRLAGRLIFKRLRYVVAMCVEKRQEEIRVLQNETSGLSLDDLETAQYAFLLLIEAATASKKRTANIVDNEGINNDHEHAIILSLDHLQESGLVEVLVDQLQLDNTGRVLSILNPKEKGALDFPDFIVGLQHCTEESCAIDSSLCDPTSLLQDLLVHLSKTTTDHHRSSRRRVLDDQRQEYSDRFDAMLVAFAGWEDRVPKESGRRLDVLRGCFVGARNVPIRDALRIVYVDAPAMRVAGNTIFALMSALIPKH